MKKSFVLASILGCFVLQSYAVDSTGCGFGSTLLKGQKGLIPQVLAVTTNGTSASQTFGITSGTMGCDRDGRITGGTGKVLSFLENNVDEFALDVAKGSGETIDAISSIVNVNSEKAGKILKENFDNLFPNENVDLVELSQKVNDLLVNA